ncbi:hypothetical protein [Microterricola viridarii]|uniref:Integral membrane protein n=1 Tax=Microterricola viridarii TaxID=412690 RepID=A0A1H1RV44_9MICO|nr:hypothetical protein [Microterricola viridarii]SDS39406.1 hypothetical protein SAMN04489834_1400 [Microterricola viridarii]
MELLFVALGGAILGIAARYTLPRRAEYGVVVVPAIGTATAAILWVALTWLGMAWDSGWIWLITLVGAAAVSAGAALLIGRTRAASDERLLATLSSGTATA